MPGALVVGLRERSELGLASDRILGLADEGRLWIC